MRSAEERRAQGLEDFAACGPTIPQRETAKRREAGLCIKCGRPAAPKATCADCGIKANARRKARASKRGGFDEKSLAW